MTPLGAAVEAVARIAGEPASQLLQELSGIPNEAALQVAAMLCSASKMGKDCPVDETARQITAMLPEQERAARDWHKTTCGVVARLTGATDPYHV